MILKIDNKDLDMLEMYRKNLRNMIDYRTSTHNTLDEVLDEETLKTFTMTIDEYEMIIRLCDMLDAWSCEINFSNE